MIVLESAMHWIAIVSGRKAAKTLETPFVATRYAAEEPA
jgi:hypothetical protein